MFSKKFFIWIVLIGLLLTGFIFYFRYQVYFSHGSYQGEKVFEISSGEGNYQVAAQLNEAGLISQHFYFYYYLRSHGFLNKIIPGEYNLSGQMTIPEIAAAITNPEAVFLKITFPEGLTISEMGDLLAKEGLDKKGFLELAQNVSAFREAYPFLNDSRIKNLEGYLFPDTYFFKKEATPSQIISKMLDNFEKKISEETLKEIKAQGKSLPDIITMASIVEKEAASQNDMKIIAGVFWNRLSIGMALQSDAPLSYILNDNTAQHSLEQLKLESPYNTYKNKGLPPGPIANPGLAAIEAAVYPTKTDYNYFLTVSSGGSRRTIFSKTFEEHVANRNKYGV